MFDVLHSFGSTDEFALKTTFEPSGVKQGTHLVKVELHEISSLRKKLAYTVKETTVDYHPPSREERLRKVLTIKNVKGQGIAIISESEKEVYREIEETTKKEEINKQDKW